MVEAASRRRLATTSMVTGSMFMSPALLDDERSRGVDSDSLAREQHGGRIELLDDGRALELVAGQQLGAVPDIDLVKFLLRRVVQRPPALDRARRIAVAAGQLRQRQAWHRDLRLQTKGDDVGVLVRRALAVDLLMQGIERVLDRHPVCLVERRRAGDAK